ncbi:uncharacterized protein LOC116215446 [Punica granatum]|uniref:Uncharacterized protein LOC116215446 n=1 Tax=Punica granatum TaxID=22663 RepID=A0A218VQZ9_PUNGR|nr:uncharacterized protein LOC116215446 [Punica granatum]OWM62925.1 hypothetical protein CDL15_Pgr020219 [Punica granatum]
MVGYSSCLSLRFTFLLSLSLTASYSAASRSSLSLKSTPPPPPKTPKATPSDLLSLLGPSDLSRQVNPLVASELSSCFKFLVPFPPAASGFGYHDKGRPTSRKLSGVGISSRREEDQLIWWPPEPVLELARLAFDSGGDPDAIHRALDPSIIPVPDIEDSKENGCELTRTPYGRRFLSEELNLYLEFLFELIVARGPAVGLNVSLNRYDFFHGHLFLTTDTGRLGILFHAKEYPAYDKKVFPYYMGYCQKGSDVIYDDSMNLRNILWLAPLPSESPKSWAAPGVLVVLDARPGGIIFRDLIPEYVNIARTIYEDDLGTVAVDVNYLNVGGAVPDYQIFIC